MLIVNKLIAKKLIVNKPLATKTSAIAQWLALCAFSIALAACNPEETPGALGANDSGSQAAQAAVNAADAAVVAKPQLSDAPTQPNVGNNPATVLVLGDSISAAYGIQREKGWVALLQQHLRGIDENFTAVNGSISGETTSGGLARFTHLLERYKPQVTVIELGGNDGLRGYPLPKLKANLTELVQLAKEHQSLVLLLGMQIPPNYGARYSDGFAQVFVEVAEREQVPLVPSFLEQVALTPGMLQADGIHPVQAAQSMLLDAVLPQLSELLPKT